MALLNVRHLRKGYGDTVVLQDLDLSLEKGEVVVILGPSGSGKSSLLRCINGLEPHQGGSIEMEGVGEFGKDVPWETARQKVGMVFQSYELFAHMNVIDNILLGPLKVQKRNRAEAEAQADKLLERVGLLGTPRAGRVAVERDVGIAGPGVEDGLDVLPGGFHGVAALIERCVAHHAVGEQALVGVGDVLFA